MQITLLDFGATRAYSRKFTDSYIRVIKAATENNTQEVIDGSVKLGFLTGYESKVSGLGLSFAHGLWLIASWYHRWCKELTWMLWWSLVKLSPRRSHLTSGSRRQLHGSTIWSRWCWNTAWLRPPKKATPSTARCPDASCFVLSSTPTSNVDNSLMRSGTTTDFYLRWKRQPAANIFPELSHSVPYSQTTSSHVDCTHEQYCLVMHLSVDVVKSCHWLLQLMSWELWLWCVLNAAR